MVFSTGDALTGAKKSTSPCIKPKPRRGELMQVATQEHGLKFQNSLEQWIAPGNPNQTKKP